MFASEVNLNDLLKGYRQEEASDLFQITSEQYVTDRDANKRGTANPSVMNNPFWLFQIRPGGLPAWKARTDFGNAEDPFADSEDPVWSFIRFGATGSKLPDGRVVCIGGEHEDGYDPDFCIYNGKYFHKFQPPTKIHINPPSLIPRAPPIEPLPSVLPVIV